MKLGLVAIAAVLASASCATGVDEPGEPPSLLVHAGASDVTVPGFDYCWDGAGCADWFGSEQPTAVRTENATLAVEWINDGVLEATIADEDAGCVSGISVDALDAPGTWELSLPDESGPYRVDFFGKADAGSVRFSIEVTSSAASIDTLPIATVGWPDTSDRFVLSVTVEHVDASSQITLEVTDAGGIVTLLSLRASEPLLPGHCGPATAGEIDIDGIGTLGEPPYSATLTVDARTESYKLVWVWPDDHSSNDIYRHTMEPAN